MAEPVEQEVDAAEFETARAENGEGARAENGEGEVEAPADGNGAEGPLARFDLRLEEAQRLLGRQTDLVEKLHLENQGLREGEVRTAQLPLVRDLLRLHDDLARMRAIAGESADDLRLVQESLLEALARNGVESFAPGEGESFDPKAHSVSGIDGTDDEQLDKTVAEVLRQGFRWDSGDLIRVVEVRAYRFVGPE